MILEEIIEDSKLLDLFRVHCFEELCSENLFFMLQFKQYKKLKNQKELAYSIYHSFIKENSEFELNLSVNRKKDMYNIFNHQQEKIDANIFNQIAFDVEWNLSDSLHRFQQKIQKKKTEPKQLITSFSNMSKKLQMIKRLFSERLQGFERERRNSSSSSSDVSNSPVSTPKSKYTLNSISQTQNKLCHKCFFDDDDTFIEDFDKKEFTGSCSLKKNKTFFEFEKSSKSDWC